MLEGFQGSICFVLYLHFIVLYGISALNASHYLVIEIRSKFCISFKSTKISDRVGSAGCSYAKFQYTVYESMVIMPPATLVGDFPFHFAVGDRSFISIILKMFLYVVVGMAFPRRATHPAR